MIPKLEFGLQTFGDVNSAPDGRVLSHAEVIRNIIEEGVLADRSGADLFGIGEHHQAELAVSSPEIVLAAIAARTERIRISTAATVLSSDDPIRVFQRLSTLSASSGDRAELIVGRGWYKDTFHLFGIDETEYDTAFRHKLGVLIDLARSGKLTFKPKGQTGFAKCDVYPPLQAPLAKVWLAVGSSAESALRAAQLDLPIILAVIGGKPDRFLPLIQIYRQACLRLGREPGRVGVHSVGYISESDDEARAEVWEHYKQMRDVLGAQRGWAPISREKFEIEVEHGSLYIGSPRTVARKIARSMRTLDASRFDMRYSIGTLSHQEIARSITLYGAQVVPEVREILRHKPA